jgi:hypothetical protein
VTPQAGDVPCPAPRIDADSLDAGILVSLADFCTRTDLLTQAMRPGRVRRTRSRRGEESAERSVLWMP